MTFANDCEVFQAQVEKFVKQFHAEMERLEATHSFAISFEASGTVSGGLDLTFKCDLTSSYIGCDAPTSGDLTSVFAEATHRANFLRRNKTKQITSRPKLEGPAW